MYHQIPEACYKIDNSLQKRLTAGADSARPAAPANSSPFPQNFDSLVESKLWQTEIGCSVTNPATRENIYRQLGFHRKHQVFHLKQHSNNDLKRQIEPMKLLNIILYQKNLLGFCILRSSRSSDHLQQEVLRVVVLDPTKSERWLRLHRGKSF